MLVTYIFLALALPIVVALSLSPISELISFARRKDRSTPNRSGSASKLLFLVPAHNEELLISACVRSILAIDYPAEARSVVVIADNCTDRTSEIARSVGAVCLERSDPEQPGKPHAIAWAIDQLSLTRWEALVIVDADTTIDQDFAWELTRYQPLYNKCVQAYNGISNEGHSWLTYLADLLTKVRYELVYPLKRAAGLNCPLTGDGMVIGTGLLTEFGWPAVSLTENWELYAWYTAKGVVIEYSQGSRLFHLEAHSLRQSSTQRKRWLAGRMWVLFNYGGQLCRSPNIGIHQKVDALCELVAPGPVLQGAIVLAIAVMSVVLFPGGIGAVIASAAVLSLLLLVLQSGYVVIRHPQRWRVSGALLLLPIYAVWRSVVAVQSVGTLVKGQWTRTNR